MLLLTIELDKKTIGIINDIGIDAAAFEQLPVAVEFHQAHMRFMHDLNWHTYRGLEEQSDIGKIMYAAGFEYTTFLAQLNKEGQLSCYAQHEERIRSTPELWVGTIKSVLRISKKFGCAMADSLLHEVSNPIALTEKLVCGQIYFVGNCIGFVRKCISVSATTLYHCATDIPGTCESIVTITQQVTHAIKKIPYQEIGKWVAGLPSVTGHDIAQGVHNTMRNIENNDALIKGVAQCATEIMINHAGIKFWKGIYNTGALGTSMAVARQIGSTIQVIIDNHVIIEPAKKIAEVASKACAKNFAAFLNQAPYIGKTTKEIVEELEKIDAKTLLDVIHLPKEVKTLKQFDLIVKMVTHVISDDHTRSGLLKIGDHIKIVERIVEKIITADILEGLAIGDNQIETIINGLEATIRCHQQNGKIMSITSFLTHTSKQPNGIVRGKLIRLLHD